MHDTLSALIERALSGNPRPLEFYLRENSRLPGSRANLELVNDFSHLLSQALSHQAEEVRALLNYFANGERKQIESNSPAEFIVFCGVVASGECAATLPAWREQTIEMLNHYACSPYWRIREAVTLAYQHLLTADVHGVMPYLMRTATVGNFYQQRAAVTAIAEPRLLYDAVVSVQALTLQRIVLENFHAVPQGERKNEPYRVLRRALGYTLSVVTAALPEQGFALMRESVLWHDEDVNWVLRENLKKKRLARFTQDAAVVTKLLVGIDRQSGV